MFKLLALILMTLDHIGFYFASELSEPIYFLLRAVGRLSFPMFAYAIVKGMYFTKNLSRYLARLTIFSLLTQVLINLTCTITHHKVLINVLFTFILGILFCQLLDITQQNYSRCSPAVKQWFSQKEGRHIGVGLTGIALVVAALIRVRPDYDFYGVLTIYVYKILFDRHPETWGSAALKPKNFADLKPVFSAFLIFNLIVLALELIPFLLSNQKNFSFLIQHLSILHIFFLPLDQKQTKPGKIQKYSFYFYYPLHICFMMLLSRGRI